jgi:hypothetical protein
LNASTVHPLGYVDGKVISLQAELKGSVKEVSIYGSHVPGGDVLV